MIRDSSVQRICEAFDCTPNELFRWYGSKESHLQALNILPMAPPTAFLKELNQQELDLLFEKAQSLTAQPKVNTDLPKGTLRLNVLRLVEQRQPGDVHTFLSTKGFTTAEAKKLLSDDRKAVKLGVLTRLCVVFGCLPNDLYDWEGSEEHRLNALRKTPVIDLKGLLEQLPPEEVQRVLRELGVGNN